jgi:hypothetical protein
MRQVKLSDGTILEVRGLLRKELRHMQENGMDPAALMPGKATEAVDHVFGLVLPPEVLPRLEELPNADSVRIWRAVLKETYGDGDESKN